jgi:hypothetical protein
MRDRFAAAYGIASLTSLACTAPADPLAATMPAPKEAIVAPPTPDRCFGDGPPEAISQDPRPRDLFANGKEVIWRSGGVLHRRDVATGRASTLDASRLWVVKAADSRDVFGADNHMDVMAIDLSSGHVRVVSQSDTWPAGSAKRPLRGVVTLAFYSTQYALDSDYVYVAWTSDPATYSFDSQGDNVRRRKGSHDLGDLARVKRDGSSAPEFLGTGPEGRFIVFDGYAYWSSRWEGVKRRALVPGATNEIIWAAPDVPYSWPIGVSAGRVYFSVVASPDPPSPTYSIESMPATPPEADAGTAQPRVHVTSTELTFGDAILDGKCVYSGGPMGVTRANLEDGTVRRLIEGRPVPGDTTVSQSRFLATDGRSLYWADNGGDRVVRWSR